MKPAIKSFTAIIPYEYLKARKAGASKEELLKIVKGICTEASKRCAARQGEEYIPGDVGEHLVALTYDMYEHAIDMGEGTL